MMNGSKIPISRLIILRDILDHAGRISHELAIQHAEQEYEEFNRKRIKAEDELESDFDRSVKIIEQTATTRNLPKQKDKSGI